MLSTFCQLLRGSLTGVSGGCLCWVCPGHLSSKVMDSMVSEGHFKDSEHLPYLLKPLDIPASALFFFPLKGISTVHMRGRLGRTIMCSHLETTFPSPNACVVPAGKLQASGENESHQAKPQPPPALKRQCSTEGSCLLTATCAPPLHGPAAALLRGTALAGSGYGQNAWSFLRYFLIYQEHQPFSFPRI